jgi:hypothetical protein
MTGAAVSRRTSARIETSALGSFSVPKGNPSPPSAQYSPSPPYASDHAAAA